MAVGNAGKWLRAQQHDSNTESMMSVLSCFPWLLAKLGKGYEQNSMTVILEVWCWCTLLLWLLAMLGNGYALNSMTVILEVWCRCTPVFYGCWQYWEMATSPAAWQLYWKYYVGALLCSMAVGNAGIWLRAQQHDSNTGSMMLVLSCVLWLLAMLGNGYELNSITVILEVWCRCTPVFRCYWQCREMATSSTAWQLYWKYDVGAPLCSKAVGNNGKWLRAQQHDSNTGSMMSVHSCVLWLLAMLGNGYELKSITVILEVWCRCTSVFYGCWQCWEKVTSSTVWQ